MSISSANAAQIGLTAAFTIKAARGFSAIKLSDGSTLPDIRAQAVIVEKHTDELEVTNHPVEIGSMISDHAFKHPSEVTLTLGWSESRTLTLGTLLSGDALSSSSSLQATYAALLKLQRSRAIFNIATGKRLFIDMVCKSLSTETTSASEHSLLIVMTCKQVLRVSTETATLPAAAQARPSVTASLTSMGKKALASTSVGQTALSAVSAGKTAIAALGG